MIWLVRAAGCVLLAMACGCGGGGNRTGGAGAPAARPEAGRAAPAARTAPAAPDGAGGPEARRAAPTEELPLQWTKIDPVRERWATSAIRN